MTSEDHTEAGARDDTNHVDERFRALLEGLRTTLPGVQVLFAFLLTLPFQSSFVELAGSGRTAYSIAFGTAAMSSILLIAPSVHQRVRAPMTGMQRHSMEHLKIAVWLTIAGTATFLVALSASVYLIAEIILDGLAAFVAVAVIAGLAGWAWIYLPAVTFRRRT